MGIAHDIMIESFEMTCRIVHHLLYNLNEIINLFTFHLF